MIGLDMLVFLFEILGVERYTPLRDDQSCAQSHERKEVKGDPVVQAGIAAERKAKERKEIGINAVNTEAEAERTGRGEAG